MTPFLAWVLTGAAAGWVAGRAFLLRNRAAPGNLLLGATGGLIGGLLFHDILGLTAGAGAPTHVLVSLSGGVLLVVAVRVLDATVVRGRAGPEAGGGAGVDLESQVRRLGDLERGVLALFLRHKPVARDSAADFEGRATFGERVADRVASFGGSWSFIGLFLSGMLLWILVNNREQKPFDPYPYILLNLLLSCLAALQAPVIMMSQNRQAVKDRLDAQNDYRVNLNAEMQVLALHTKVDQLREEQLAELMALQRRQVELMARLLGPDGGPGGAAQSGEG